MYQAHNTILNGLNLQHLQLHLYLKQDKGAPVIFFCLTIFCLLQSTMRETVE